MNLYLDDLRPCPKHFTLAKNYNEAINLLNTHHFNFISLDHDLGEKYTGYDVALYMVTNNIWPSNTIYIHSANPTGRFNMIKLLKQHAPPHVKIQNGPAPFHFNEGDI